MVSLLLIAKDKKFLLLKRTDNGHKFSGYWGLPGGSVEKDETPLDAVIREVKEEIGLDIPNVKLLNTYKYPHGVINVYVYNSTDFDPTKIVLNDEHTEWKMCSYSDIYHMKNMIPTTIAYTAEFLSNPNF
jgi:mutator protein MutT